MLLTGKSVKAIPEKRKKNRNVSYKENTYKNTKWKIQYATLTYLFIYFSVKYATQSNDCDVSVNKQSILFYSFYSLIFYVIK